MNTYSFIKTSFILSVAFSFGAWILPTHVEAQQSLSDFEMPVKLFFTAENNPFPDTDINSLSGKAAAELYDRGIINGFPDGEFKGTQAVNRAQAAKFLLQTKNISVDSSYKNELFSDTDTKEWYFPFIATAHKRGIIKGYSDNTFLPGEGVNTAEFIKMMALTFELETNLPHSFIDEDDYKNAWFWVYAGAAEKYQFFPHRNNKLRPELKLTRSEVAVAIYQYLKNKNIDTEIPPHSSSTGITDTTSDSVENEPENNISAQYQLSSSSTETPLILGKNTLMSIEIIPSKDVDPLKSITIELVKEGDLSIDSLEIRENNSLLGSINAPTDRQTLTLNSVVSADVAFRFDIIVDIKNASPGASIQVIIPKNGITGNYQNLLPLADLAQDVQSQIFYYSPTSNSSNASPETQTSSGNSDRIVEIEKNNTQFTPAPSQPKIEGGYISASNDPNFDIIGLEFDLTAEVIKTTLNDFNIQSSTEIVGEFQMYLNTPLQDGDRVVIGLCGVDFSNVGPFDDDCSDNTAVFDIASSQNLINPLAQLQGIDNYDISSPSTDSSVVIFRQQQASGENARFIDNSNGALVQRVVQLGQTNNSTPLNNSLVSAEVRIDDLIVGKADAITADQIQFKDLGFVLEGDRTYRVQILPEAKSVVSGSAKVGQFFRLEAPGNTFFPSSGAEIVDSTGKDTRISINETLGENMFVSSVVPLIENQQISSSSLGVGTLDFLRFKLSKRGDGNIEVGSGLFNSQLQVQIRKTTGVDIGSCELRSASGVTLASTSADPNQNGRFFASPFGAKFNNIQAVKDASSVYVSFDESTFEAGQRLEANGSEYSVLCEIIQAGSNTSMQVNIPNEAQLFFIDSSAATTPLNDASRLEILPINGTVRASR